jgi:mycofactocin precursor
MDDQTTLTPAPTSTLTDSPTPEPTSPSPTATPVAEQLLDDELLVEEISIDGMCGVY